MAPSSIVVIGASLGGVQALQDLAAGLDPVATAAWCIVLHVDAHRSSMPALLQRAGRLPAQHAGNGDALLGGRIYVAPPDQHLMVRDSRVFLSHGPRENWARPAIDPLFRSAAAAFGRRTIGVILTGRLNDGTAGLAAVKRQGGLTVVQDPRDARCPAMPRSALRHVAVDHRVPLGEMPALLNRLVSRGMGPSARPAEAEGGSHV